MHIPDNPSKSVTTGSGVSTEQATTAAVKFIKQVYPSLTGVLALAPESNTNILNISNNGQKSIQFVLLVHGIPTTNNVSVTIDSTGQVVDLSFPTWALREIYPTPSHVIPVSQAEDAYLQAAPLQLAYELPIAHAAEQSDFQHRSQAILVYAPNWTSPYEQLDATTGQWVGVLGTQVAPKDIAGHAGAEEIALLAAHGTLPVADGQVHPDAPVTRGEFVSWLVNATGKYYGNANSMTQSFADVSPDNKYYADLQQAVAQGWLPVGGDFRPNDTLTRGEAAQLIVDWLGWSKLAAKSDLFAVPYTDRSAIPADELGAVAIASEFGIIPPVNGAFLPGNTMTVADAAVAIVHALRTAYDDTVAGN